MNLKTKSVNVPIDLFKEGKVRVSSSPYAAIIFMVRKLHGFIRVCIGYCAINERTAKDSGVVQLS